MRRPGLLIFGSLVLVATACGGDTSTAPTTPTTTAPASTTTTATSAPITSTTAATTTTTAAPTTTAATTTTLEPTTTQPTVPPDAHPVLGGPSWAALWPPDGATAAYRVTRMNGTEADLDARIEYGVEFEDTIYDRFVFGSDEPGGDGLVVYFDRSEPWTIKIKASQTFSESETRGPAMTEFFDVPLPFAATGPIGETSVQEGTIQLDFLGGIDTFGVTYSTTVLAIDESLEVPFGTLEGLVHVETVVGGPFMGGGEFASEMWLHPEFLLVRMTGSPAWDDIQLITPFA